MVYPVSNGLHRQRGNTTLRNDVLVRARKDLGLLQKDVARGAGISVCYFSQIETIRTYPPRHIQENICKFYSGRGVPLEPENTFPLYLKEFVSRPDKTVQEVPFRDVMGTHSEFVWYEEELVDHVAREDLVTVMHEALSIVTPKQRQIIKLIYGFGGDTPRSLSQVGKLLGVSPQYVRQEREKALEKFRNLKTAKKLVGYYGHIDREHFDPSVISFLCNFV